MGDSTGEIDLWVVLGSASGRLIDILRFVERIKLAESLTAPSIDQIRSDLRMVRGPGRGNSTTSGRVKSRLSDVKDLKAFSRTPL